MKLSRTKTITSFFLAAILSAPLFGASTPLPGTLNFVEGKAQIGNEDVREATEEEMTRLAPCGTCG